MNVFRVLLAVTAMLFGAVSAHAQAVHGQGTWESTLLGRDINLNPVAATSDAAVYLYDTTLNVTWLRDANMNGAMDWNTAMSWAANLVTGSGAAAISGWRLPTMAANEYPSWSLDGSTALGYNVPTSSSEMASLFFSTLGNKSYRDINANIQAGSGLTNTGSFQNMQSMYYWLGALNASYTDNPWFFRTNDGYQDAFYPKLYQLSAMAVHPGDVTPVPEPETYAMLLAGLGLIGAVARRRKVGSML